MEGMAEQKRDRIGRLHRPCDAQGNADYVALVQNSLRAAPFSASFEYEWDNLDPAYVSRTWRHCSARP